jgi:hypothetical protein
VGEVSRSGHFTYRQMHSRYPLETWLGGPQDRTRRDKGKGFVFLNSVIFHFSIINIQIIVNKRDSTVYATFVNSNLIKLKISNL